MFVVKDAVREPLYVIVPYFNPWRWKSREKHTERALKHFHDSGAVIILVESAFNRREDTFDDFQFNNSGLDGMPAMCNVLGEGKFRHKYVALRTKDELWLKENMINLGVAHIPDQNWQQIAWLDSDVHFVRPNWVGECIHKLQHFAFLQMFSSARDVGPNYDILSEDYPHASGLSFVKAWENGLLDQKLGHKHHHHHHHHPHPYYEGYYAGRVFPGLAWACTRQAFDDVGGLLDFAIWGGGDWHMAHALIEKTEGMMRNDLHHDYKKMVMQWYYRCHTHIRRNIGVMDGLITHMWHGKKTGRGYNNKHSALASIGFDPLRHLKKDYQGLYQLHDDGSTAFVKLRDTFRRIAKERNEDSIDI